MGEKSVKKKRRVEFCHGAALQRKLDHSGPSELLDVCVLSLEDGWLIRAIFTVGRKVEDCVFFFLFLSSPVCDPLSHLYGVKLCCQCR